jgi:uncharacterized membrane protein YbhN (UPF0104 family)
VLLHPRVFVGLLNVVLRRIGKPALPARPGVGEYLLPLLCAFSQWFFAGVALWCVARAFGEIAGSALPTMIAVQACAMTLGYLALIAPGGLGVTDGIRLVVLKVLLPAHGDATIAMIVIVMRLMQTVLELGLAGVGAAMWRLDQKKAAPTS